MFILVINLVSAQWFLILKLYVIIFILSSLISFFYTERRIFYFLNWSFLTLYVFTPGCDRWCTLILYLTNANFVLMRKSHMTSKRRIQLIITYYCLKKSFFLLFIPSHKLFSFLYLQSLISYNIFHYCHNHFSINTLHLIIV